MDVAAARRAGAGHLLRGVRRHWWLTLAVTLAGLAIALGLLLIQPTRFSSGSAILVLPVPADLTAGPGTLAAGGGFTAVNLATEAQLVRSTETARRAAALLGGGSAPAELVDAVTVDPVANTSVLEVHFEADTPARAQAGGRAIARAYLTARADAANATLAEDKAIVRASLAESSSQLADLDSRIAHTPPGSPQLPTLRSARATVADQTAALSGRLGYLNTIVVNPGEVIRDADLPSAPVPARAWVFPAAGLGGGILAGVIAAGIWERLEVRVRDGLDLVDRAGVAVLAELVDGVAALHAPGDESGRDYHRLRNVVVAALPASDGVLLVTSASTGSGSTVVAANLAAALARTGHEVILVGANAPAIGHPPVLLSAMFDISDVPGLSDVLSGRTDLGSAMQVPPREPRLRVIAPGGAASASRLLQSAAVPTVVGRLRTLARFVLIDSPSAASGADAQSLGGLADAAIIVAEARYSRLAEVVDAAEQMHLVGARVLGAVVLPRVVARADPDDMVVFIGTASGPWERRMAEPFGGDTGRKSVTDTVRP
jgi:Mrp family chromosome partitioning ATPase